MLTEKSICKQGGMKYKMLPDVLQVDWKAAGKPTIVLDFGFQAKVYCLIGLDIFALMLCIKLSTSRLPSFAIRFAPSHI